MPSSTAMNCVNKICQQGSSKAIVQVTGSLRSVVAHDLLYQTGHFIKISLKDSRLMRALKYNSIHPKLSYTSKMLPKIDNLILHLDSESRFRFICKITWKTYKVQNRSPKLQLAVVQLSEVQDNNIFSVSLLLTSN